VVKEFEFMIWNGVQPNFYFGGSTRPLLSDNTRIWRASMWADRRQANTTIHKDRRECHIWRLVEKR
jgi:hypothetical protein